MSDLFSLLGGTYKIHCCVMWMGWECVGNSQSWKALESCKWKKYSKRRQIYSIMNYVCIYHALKLGREFRARENTKGKR